MADAERQADPLRFDNRGLRKLIHRLPVGHSAAPPPEKLIAVGGGPCTMLPPAERGSREQPRRQGPARAPRTWRPARQAHERGLAQWAGAEERVWLPGQPAKTSTPPLRAQEGALERAQTSAEMRARAWARAAAGPARLPPLQAQKRVRPRRRSLRGRLGLRRFCDRRRNSRGHRRCGGCRRGGCSAYRRGCGLLRDRRWSGRRLLRNGRRRQLDLQFRPAISHPTSCDESCAAQPGLNFPVMVSTTLGSILRSIRSISLARLSLVLTALGAACKSDATKLTAAGTT